MAGTGIAGLAPDPGRARRGASLRDHRPSRPAREGARDVEPLEEIPGIGAHRRSALLRHFGGLGGVQKAGIEELMRVQRDQSRISPNASTLRFTLRSHASRTMRINDSTALTLFRDRCCCRSWSSSSTRRFTGANVAAAVDLHRRGDHRLARWLDRAALGHGLGVRRVSRSGRRQADGRRHAVPAGPGKSDAADGGHERRHRRPRDQRSRRCASGWPRSAQRAHVRVAALGKIKTVAADRRDRGAAVSARSGRLCACSTSARRCWSSAAVLTIWSALVYVRAAWPACCANSAEASATRSIERLTPAAPIRNMRGLARE